MRFSTAATTALAAAAAPALVSAAKGTMGFALGSKNSDNSCKTERDYGLDFDAIKAASGATTVRGYAASQCDFAKNALPAAKDKGFKVVLGIWYVSTCSFSQGGR